MALFDNCEREAKNPYSRDHQESPRTWFQHLNRSNKEGVEKLRQMLESSFSELPLSEQKSTAGDARSDNVDQCDGVLFELVIHKVLIELGFTITRHPEIPGTYHRPDYLVCEGEKSCYVEAMVTGHGPFDLNGNEEQVIDLLNNNLSSSEFCIGVKMEGKLKNTLGKNQVVPRFCQLLEKHTYDEVKHLHDFSGRYHTPSETIECGNWRLTGWLYPVKVPDSELASRRAIVLHPYEPQLLTDGVTRVQKAIREKAKRYGCPDRPFVMAVAPRNHYFASLAMQRDTMFGTSYMHYDDLESQPELKRGKDNRGVMTQLLPETTIPRLAGVLLCERIDIRNLSWATACLYVNPYSNSATELPDSLFRLPFDRERHLQNGEITMEHRDGISLPQILGLN